MSESRILTRHGRAIELQIEFENKFYKWLVNAAQDAIPEEINGYCFNLF